MTTETEEIDLFFPQRIDPGVNLDSCGEDSDSDTPNNVSSY